MAEQFTCPMIGCEGQLETSDWSDLACPVCGVAGSEGVLDVIRGNHQQLLLLTETRPRALLDVPPSVGDAVRWVDNGKPHVGEVVEVRGPVESQAEPGKMVHILSVRTGIWSTSCLWPSEVTHVLRAIGGCDG